MSAPSVDQLELGQGDEVLFRVDFNVPLNGNEVADDTRIRAVLPTLNLLREAKCKTVICSHLGRPRGTRDEALSLEPAAARLAALLEDEIVFVHDTVGEPVEQLVRDLPPGGVLVLENLRFNPGEKSGDEKFAGALSRLARNYVVDAFGTLHRDDASITGVPPLMEKAGVGLLVHHEIEAIDRFLDTPTKPVLGILGGAKVSDKIGVLESLSRRCDTLLIGGAMSYTFLAARGQEVGSSKIESNKVRLATRLLERCEERNCEVLLPVDHVVADSFAEGAEHKVVEEIEEGWMALDIGPATVAAYSEVIAKAGSVFWNGPMGVFEWDAFKGGTQGVAEAVASTKAYTLVGGGDSAAAVAKFGLSEKMDHVSTGGGATLHYIEGHDLPGLTVLHK